MQHETILKVLLWCAQLGQCGSSQNPSTCRVHIVGILSDALELQGCLTSFTQAFSEKACLSCLVVRDRITCLLTPFGFLAWFSTHTTPMHTLTNAEFGAHHGVLRANFHPLAFYLLARPVLCFFSIAFDHILCFQCRTCQADALLRPHNRISKARAANTPLLIHPT